jgi:hypothetical protein
MPAGHRATRTRRRPRRQSAELTIPNPEEELRLFPRWRLGHLSASSITKSNCESVMMLSLGSYGPVAKVRSEVPVKLKSTNRRMDRATPGEQVVPSGSSQREHCI